MPLPQRALGRDLFWWLTRTGILSATVESRLGRRLAATGHADRLEPQRARAPPRRRGQAARDRCFRAARSRSRTEPRWRWTRSSGRPVTAPTTRGSTFRSSTRTGRLRHRRGVTDVPGLFFLGLTWQYTRGSALIGWVKDDAAVHRRAASKAAAAHGTPVGTGRPPPTPARPKGANRCIIDSESHGEIIDSRVTTEGLPEARGTELVELADGDEFALRDQRPSGSGSGMPPCACSPTTAPSPGRR